MAMVELSSGQLRQALATERETTETTRKLSLADPRDAQSGTALADDYVLLADLESRSGHAQAASSDLKQAASLLKQFIGLSPEDTDGAASQANLYVVTGNVASRSGDNRGALKSYGAAIEVLSNLQSENSQNVAVRDRLAAIYNEIGRVQIKIRDFQAATATLNRAVSLGDVETASANADAQALYTMADSYSGLGDIEAALGTDTRRARPARVEHWQHAVSWYERSLTTWTQIKEPGMVGPDGFNAVPPSIVATRLAKYKAVLASEHAARQR
jgi:tetratricopeptide (TPR) repeat protein